MLARPLGASARSVRRPLTGIHPQRLGAVVLKASADRNRIATSEVDDVIRDTSSKRGQQSGDLGRMSALDASYDMRSSGDGAPGSAPCPRDDVRGRRDGPCNHH
jgi:acetyl-CoA acetyltransferase